MHSISNQPILANEFDADSDGDDMYLTLTRSNKLIDEFIDINRGEKQMIKLWNNFMNNSPRWVWGFLSLSDDAISLAVCLVTYSHWLVSW